MSKSSRNNRLRYVLVDLDIMEVMSVKTRMMLLPAFPNLNTKIYRVWDAHPNLRAGVKWPFKPCPQRTHGAKARRMRRFSTLDPEKVKAVLARRRLSPGHALAVSEHWSLAKRAGVKVLLPKTTLLEMLDKKSD